MFYLTDMEKLYLIYMYFLACFLVLCFDTYIGNNPTPILKKIQDVPKLDETQQYLLNAKTAFIIHLSKTDDTECYKSIQNSNINEIFYNKKDFTEYIKEENTELEQIWKTRILMESTPRGNIIMYYNAYKQGFGYYSDQSISYPILNAVSMKYVARYFCLDFFIDNSILPENMCSPLMKLIEDDDINERANKTNIMKKMSIDVKTDFNNEKKPFAKLKNYNIQPIKTLSLIHPDSIVNTSDTYSNKFIYMGKIANFSILQKIPKRRENLFADKSSVYKTVFEEVEQPQRKMDYKSFLTMFSKKEL
jgi:hypothetical protein